MPRDGAAAFTTGGEGATTAAEGKSGKVVRAVWTGGAAELDGFIHITTTSTQETVNSI